MISILNFGWRWGNQLYQIACAIGLSEKHNSGYVIPEWKYNNFLKLPIKTSSVQNKVSYIFKENGFHYQEIPFRENMAIEGYFQSEKYFEHCKEKVVESFEPKEELLKKLKEKHKSFLEKENICSIHVRRGDYLNYPDHHPAQNLNYYMKAVKQFPKDYVFYVFSDDTEWCKENFPIGEKFFVVEGQNEIEDFYTMSMCANNIIGNSSFSWWAAWLNKNPNKKTIAPNKWFGPAYSHFSTKDLFPESWIVL
jgi:hypothetical protein